jgi:hypothetical protein
MWIDQLGASTFLGRLYIINKLTISTRWLCNQTHDQLTNLIGSSPAGSKQENILDPFRKMMQEEYCTGFIGRLFIYSLS